jgi:hypothetical protein
LLPKLKVKIQSNTDLCNKAVISYQLSVAGCQIRVVDCEPITDKLFYEKGEFYKNVFSNV